jgi:hypothetical protein
MATMESNNSALRSVIFPVKHFILFNTDPFSSSTKRDFFNNKEFSDVTLLLGNKEIPSHKFILTQHSVFFVRLFTGEWQVGNRANNRSVTFRLTCTQESNQPKPVVTLNLDHGHRAVLEMLRFFYGFRYDMNPLCDDQGIHLHLAVYRLADHYDAPALRQEARRYFTADLRMAIHLPRAYDIPEYAIRIIQQLLGPDCDIFGDPRIQHETCKAVQGAVEILFQNELFNQLARSGDLFNAAFGAKIMARIGTRLAATTDSTPFGPYLPGHSGPEA